MIRSIGLPELVVVFVLILPVFAFWKIFSKAGYPAILSLTMLVPVLNVVMLFFLGFTEWPVLKELRAARQRTAPSA